MSTWRRRCARAAGGAVVLTVLIAAAVAWGGDRVVQQSPFPPAVPAAGTAAEQLEQLETTPGAAAVPEYRRAAFGEPWADVDHNGCSTRNDVLVRDLEQVVFFPDRNCVVASGVLHDPYTGQAIAFQHGEETSQAVQIDHLVPLALAWRSGAWSWSDERRLQFANDQAALLAVDGPTNQSKGDSGIAFWLPPVDSYRCGYVAAVVDVLARYQLTIAAEDRAAAADVLRSCPAPPPTTTLDPLDSPGGAK